MAIRDDELKSRAVVAGRSDLLRSVTAVPAGGSEPDAALTRVRRNVLRRMLAADVLGLATAGVLGPLVLALISGNPETRSGQASTVVLVDLAMIPVFLAVFACYGLYRGTTRRISLTVFSDLRNILHGLLVGGFLYAVIGYSAHHLRATDGITVGKIATMCIIGAVAVPLARIVSFGLMGRAPEGSVPVIVVGTGKLADTVASHLRAHSAVRFVGFVDDNPLQRNEVIGDLNELPDLCRRYGVARVVVCFSRTHPERTTEMLKSLSGKVGVSIVPRYYELITARSHVEDLSGLPMIDIAPASLSMGARALKRAFDVLASTILLALASPFLVITALVIKATSPGPVFFRQDRMGRHERTFKLLKFRTMFDGAENQRDDLAHMNEVDGPLFKVADDPRITRPGRLLRKTSLDEIPQLINVWKGDMSLVGPRPFVVAEAAAIDGWARKRFEARPGMTGLWQVSGRNELSHLELCRLDYLYVASWSFWWDIQILWHTPATVVRGRGAS